MYSSSFSCGVIVALGLHSFGKVSAGELVPPSTWYSL